MTSSSYKPLVFRDVAASDITFFRTVAAKIFNATFRKQNSLTQWMRAPRFPFNGQDFRDRAVSGTADFSRLVNYLQQKRAFDHDESGLPEIPVSWIDRGIPITMNFYKRGLADEQPLTLKLDSKNHINFPVQPNIDRKGMAFSSMLKKLEDILYSARTDLVLRSEMMFSGSDTYWIERLMVYLNTSISLIDSMLIMIYYKAKYDGKEWEFSFDEEKLGPTTYRTMRDKFKWVFHITGNQLNYCNEIRAFEELKGVRNHLNHFDPPIFACTIEDVARWLNHSRSVALLALKIREATKSTISPNMVKLLLMPEVAINPHNPQAERLPQKESGYRSCFG